MKAPHRCRYRGFTLIELMLALGIFMLLGLLSYRALASIIESRDRLAGEQQRWMAVTRFMQRLEIDLQQMPRTLPDALTYDAGRQTLRVIRLVASPLGEEVRTVRYRWRDGRILRDERKSLAPAATRDVAELVAPEVVLEAAEDLEWSWPADQQSKSLELVWQVPPVAEQRLPPAAIRLRVKLATVSGNVWRVFVLR